MSSLAGDSAAPERRLRDLTSVFYPSSSVPDSQCEAEDMPESIALRSRTPPDSSGTNPPALAPQEEQEALEEIRFYQSLSWDAAEAIMVGISAIPDGGDTASDVASEVGSENSEEDGELEQPSLLLPKTPHPSKGLRNLASNVDDAAESEEEEETEEMRFEMVLDMNSEELVGREEEFKTELIRDLSRSISMRPIERAAERMTKALLATPVATPFPTKQKIDRGAQDSEEEAKHENQAAGSPSGIDAHDGGSELLHAFEVRGLVLEQSSVIVELSWSPFKASRALDQERVRERDSGRIAVLQSSDGKEDTELEDAALSNASADVPAAIRSREDIFSDLEAQVYSTNSKLRSGVYSRHVTGVSMPVLRSPSTACIPATRKGGTLLGTQARSPDTSTSSSSAKIAIVSSPVTPAVLRSLVPELGSGLRTPGSVGGVDYEAPYLMQRCTLMTISSLQEQVSCALCVLVCTFCPFRPWTLLAHAR